MKTWRTRSSYWVRTGRSLTSSTIAARPAGSGAQEWRIRPLRDHDPAVVVAEVVRRVHRDDSRPVGGREEAPAERRELAVARQPELEGPRRARARPRSAPSASSRRVGVEHDGDPRHNRRGRAHRLRESPLRSSPPSGSRQLRRGRTARRRCRRERKRQATSSGGAAPAAPRRGPEAGRPRRASRVRAPGAPARRPRCRGRRGRRSRGSSQLLVELVGETRERAPGARLHRAERELEPVGDLALREPAPVGELDDGPLVRG